MTLATTGFRPLDWLLVALVVVLLVIAGLLALAETSLVRTSTVKAKALVDEGRRGARPLLRLVEKPQLFLNPVLLLVLVCQLVAATLVGVLSSAWFGAIGVVIGAVFEVVIIFVLFEAVPKTWAVQHPERAALFSAPLVAALVRFPPIRAASSVLVSLANLFGGRRDGQQEGVVTESELLAMADVAMAEEVIETQERAFIHSIIEFGDTVVREVMVPRPDILGVQAGTDVTSALVTALQAGYSRLPVYEASMDDVVGVVFAKDLIQAEHEGMGGDAVRKHQRAAYFVPETKRLSGMLREMQENKFHLAIVVDEYGSTAGLVTLEDLIEELVGEIVDEFDVEELPIQRLADGSVAVAGRMGVGDAEKLVGAELPQGPWDTVGGLVLDLAGHVPAPGESVEAPGVRLIVQRVQGRRIAQVRIVPTAPTTEPLSEQ